MEIKVVIFEDNYLLRESLFQLINGTAGLNCVGAFANCDDIIFNIQKTTPDDILATPGERNILFGVQLTYCRAVPTNVAHILKCAELGERVA